MDSQERFENMVGLVEAHQYEWDIWQAAARQEPAPTPERAQESAGVRQATLVEAIKICDEISERHNRARKTSNNPTYMEGKSDGAEDCINALHRLAANKEPQP